MSKRKICIVTGSRADYGLLYWLIKEVEKDKNLKLQHFHILLFSPRSRDKEFNKDHCIACRFRGEPYFKTCPHCTTRVLYQLIKEELPTIKDFRVTICEESDFYANTYGNKKQKFTKEYDDSYLVC